MGQGRLKLKKKGRTEGFNILGPRQPSDNPPQYTKRKLRPRQPSNRLKMKRKEGQKASRYFGPRHSSSAESGGSLLCFCFSYKGRIRLCVSVLQSTDHARVCQVGCELYCTVRQYKSFKCVSTIKHPVNLLCLNLSVHWLSSGFARHATML